MPVDAHFTEGFEDVTDFMRLFRRSGTLRWSGLERTLDGNVIDIGTDHARSGKQCLEMVAQGKRGGTVSKSALVRGGLFYEAGDRVSISGWFFLPGGQKIRDITLLDLECSTCWPGDSKSKNQSPGIRLRLLNDDGQVSVDRGKIGFKNEYFNQPRDGRQGFPRDRWVQLTLDITLGIGDAGRTRVSLDDKTLIDERGTNMPDPSVFRKLGINLKDPSYYDYVEIGISANSRSNPVKLFLDDVTIQDLSSS